MQLCESALHLCSPFDGLIQERCNSIANAMQLCLSCTNPSLCSYFSFQCHFQWNNPDKIFVTGCTAIFHFDNVKCTQWRIFHQHDGLPFLECMAVLSNQFSLVELFIWICRHVKNGDYKNCVCFISTLRFFFTCMTAYIRRYLTLGIATKIR